MPVSRIKKGMNELPQFAGECKNLVYSATATTKTALVVLQLWFHCFTASFCKALCMHFSREAKDRDAKSAVALSLLFLLVQCVWGDHLS